MKEILFITLAGGFGTLARYGSRELMEKILGTNFVYGTLFVNVLGCFLTGIIINLDPLSNIINKSTQLILLTGFMGAYTTFSTFGLETVRYLQAENWWLATINILSNLILGLLGLYLGIILGKNLLNG